MSTFSDLLKSKLQPTDAIIFYKPTQKIGSNEGSFVEHRPIDNGQFGAGSPLEINTLAKIMKTVSKYVGKNTSLVTMHGRVPSNLLYTNSSMEHHKMIWWRGPEKRMMYFAKGLGIENGMMWVPGLIYVADGRRLSVFAFKGKKPKDILYAAPFFNVYNDGGICLGSAKVQKPKDNTFENWIAYWEDMFWKSEFASLIGNNPVRSNLAVITKECIATGKQFPTEQMVKISKTFNSLFV